MKTIYFFSLCLFLFACNSNPEIVETPKKIHVINQSTTKNGITTAKFTVWGNCGMCKETIEKSLKIPGVLKLSLISSLSMIDINIYNYLK